MDPAGGTMSIEEIGRAGAVSTCWVRFRDASVVHATRRHDRPGEWSESPTLVFRWPMGTFMTVIGVRTAGTLEAVRIEIPAIE